MGGGGGGVGSKKRVKIVQKENVEKRILHCKGRRKKDFKVGTKNLAALLVVKKNDIPFRKVQTRRFYKLP